MFFVSFFVGVFAWTFAEYALHNWYGHVAKGRNEFSREHLKHHANNSYFAPTPKKVLVATMALAIVLPVAVLAAGVILGASFCVGFFLMYAAYEVVHRRCHTHAPRGPYSRWARKHHFHHHFASPKTNHGVTSPIWDLVFRTYEAPGQVRVPVKQPIAWLTDPDTGEVKRRYARDYTIARPKNRRMTPSTA